MPDRISAWQMEVVNNKPAGCPAIHAATRGAGRDAMTVVRRARSTSSIDLEVDRPDDRGDRIVAHRIADRGRIEIGTSTRSATSSKISLVDERPP
jgi:hypothetical protein